MKKDERTRYYYVWQMMKQTKKYTPYFIASVIVKTLALVLPYVVALACAHLIGNVIDGREILLVQYALLLLGLLFLSVVFSYLDTYISHDMSFKIVEHLRNQCYEKVGCILPGSVSKNKMGDYVRIITGDVNVFEWFYAHILVAWIAAIIATIIGGIMLYRLHPIALFVTIPFIFIIILVPTKSVKVAEGKGYDLRRLAGELSSIIVDGIQGMKDVISNQYEENYYEELGLASGKYNSTENIYQIHAVNEKRTIELVIDIAIILTVIFIVNCILSPLMITEKLSIVFLIMVFFVPLQQTLNDGTNYGFVFGAAKRVYDLLNEEEIVKDEGYLVKNDVVVASKDGQLVVDFNGVKFSYPAVKDKLILNNLTFSLQLGETVALVGPSGGGKSTIVGLLQRFWDPNNGTIRINGLDIKDIKISELRDLMTIVPQEIYFFNMSILDNLLMAKPDASEDEIIFACKQAKAWEFINDLPEGLNTKVGERGLRFSGGQKQRLALAQAFLRKSPILILDEATANLDVHNEKVINEVIEELKKGRITFIIAHRITTIQSADRVVLLRNGKVEDVGKYEDLIQTSQYFCKLVGEEYDE